MYESHFGIARSPFQLTPDPWFYFDSPGHAAAMAVLRRGCGPGQAFLVVSGEIGSGKSMLVRTMLDELGPSVLVRYLGSTQLSGDELKGAVAGAFGIALRESPGMALETAFPAMLASLRLQGKRALLIIDEAQHLDRQGLLMLDALAPRLDDGAPAFEIWLVGQPELRQKLEHRELLALRERVGAFCHLGPLTETQTRGYVEHRLRKAGWAGRPAFEPEAFGAIHEGTGGVPRQINRLCNRLLLLSYLSSSTAVDAHEVAQAAHELQLESEGRHGQGLPGEPSSEPTLVLEVAQDAGPPPAAAPAPPATTVAIPATRDGLMIVVGGQADHIKAAALIAALHERAPDVACTLVRAHDNEALRLHEALFASLRDRERCVELGVAAGSQAERTLHVTQRFSRLLEERRPDAMLVLGGSELALACAVVGGKQGVPVASVGAGVRLLQRTRTGDLARVLTDRMGQVLYTDDEAAAANLQLDGVAPQRIHRVGNVAADALALGLRTRVRAERQPAFPDEVLVDRRGFALVVLDKPANVERRERLTELVQVLRQARRDLPLVWIMKRRTEQRLKDFGLSGGIAGDRIACLPRLPYPAFVRLLDRATCVLSDSSAVNDEALMLGVPCLGFFDPADRECGAGAQATVAIGADPKRVTRALWSILYGGTAPAAVPALWDGQACLRIAEHVAAWRADRRPSLPLQDPIASQPG